MKDITNLFFLPYCLYHPIYHGLALFVLCALYTFLISDFLNFLNTPDAVSSSEDPLAGDQSAATSVVEAAATLVLQRHLRRANNDVFYDFRKCSEDTEFKAEVSGGHTVPARASCSYGHLLHQPPW